MKKCPNCKKNYDKDINFCESCGSALTTDLHELKFLSEKSVFEEKIKADSLNINILSEFLEFLKEHRKFKEALGIAYKILAIEKDNLYAQKQTIICLKYLGEIDEAFEFAKDLFERDTNNIDIVFELAYLSKTKDLHEKSLELFEHITRINPPDIRKTKAIALLLTESNKYKSSVQLWKEIFSNNHKDIHARLFKAISDYEDKEYKKAKVIFNELLCEFETNNYYRIIVIIYLTALLLSSEDTTEKDRSNEIFEELVTSKKIDFLYKEAKAMLGEAAVLVAEHNLKRQNYIQAKHIYDLLISWGNKESADRVNSIIHFEKARKHLDNREYRKSLSLNKRGLKTSVNGSREYDLLKAQRITILKKRRNYYLIIVIPLLIFIGILLTDCSIKYFSERADWKTAQNQNSLASYEAYIEKYPNGRYYNEATILLEELKSKKEVTEILQPEIDEDKELERVLSIFENLYLDLLEIKDQEDFETFGFAIGGPYNYWVKKVNELKNDPFSKLLQRKSLVVGDLEVLANEYVETGGIENEDTRTFNMIIADAFQPETVAEKPVIVSKSPQEHQLFGKWAIEHRYSSRLDHRCEIYHRDSDYYSVLTFQDGSTRRENLRKEGNRYYIVGNRSGDYYLITPGNKRMTLHDRQGTLDMYVARRIN